MVVRILPLDVHIRVVVARILALVDHSQVVALAARNLALVVRNLVEVIRNQALVIHTLA